MSICTIMSGKLLFNLNPVALRKGAQNHTLNYEVTNQNIILVWPRAPHPCLSEINVSKFPEK